MSLLFGAGLILFIFEFYNLYSSVQYNRIFIIGFLYKTDRNMSVFQLKQEAGKSFSLGNWYQEGDSKFKVGVVINVIYLFVSIFMLING